MACGTYSTRLTATHGVKFVRIWENPDTHGVGKMTLIIANDVLLIGASVVSKLG